MGLVAHLKMMADYHQWAHQKLVQHIEALSDDEYRRDCGLYFKSVHGTLNHLLVGDRLWHGRVVNEPVEIPGLDHELYKKLGSSLNRVGSLT